MSGPAKGKVSISTETSEAKRAYIDERAERLEWSRGKVVSQLIDFWLALGAPPLSDLDSLRNVPPIPANARVILPTWWASYKPKDTDESSQHLQRATR